ncbi:MAG TPA: rhodanese-like domain-containing protein [Methylococcaceae bacterium]|nr:rhodanese-like domain-containing protein [Methylococcaceae bacterium]
MDRILEFASNHYILVSGIAITAVLLIQDFYEGLTRRHNNTSAAGAVTLMNEENSVVLDVREPDEYAKGHIEGAVYIPFGKLKERVAELEGHKNAPVIVTCQSGTRSGHACAILQQNGFTRVYNLAGGMMEWEEAKMPVTRKKGK